MTHALPTVVLHLHAAADRSGCVQVHVGDGGPQPASAATSWAATRADDEHGRGDMIITALADHTGNQLRYRRTHRPLGQPRRRLTRPAFERTRTSTG
ncbi:hypothetical protein [Streptomyces sp. NBC_00289]|uniref:hypothetical protein n=1 Tax=Streptomyces sp. NBC_00289 TaxID=2975703 RepID=UPI00352C950E